MAKILEQASRVLAIVGGAMLAPVREGAANPFIPCSWNVPPGNNCNGLCPIGENCATIAAANHSAFVRLCEEAA